MAVLCAIGTGNYLQRTVGLLPPSGDSTYSVWVKEPVAVAVNPAYNTPFVLLDDPGVYTDFAGVFSMTGAAGNFFEVTGAAAITGAAALATQWNHYAWTQAGSIQTFYRNLTLIGSRTVSRAGFTVGFDLLGNDSFGPGGLTVAYARQWTRALTPIQLRAEMNTPIAVDATDLWLDTPLESDLLDVSGHGRHWTAIGSTSFVEPPLTVLADSYSDTSSFPITRVVTPAEQNPTGDLWFKWEVAAPEGLLLGNFATRDNTIPFFPRSENYWLVDGNGTTFGASFSTYGGSTRGWWMYLPKGRYYQRYRRNPSGGAIVADYTITWSKAPVGNTTVPRGTLVVNDDTNTRGPYLGFPGVALNLDTGGIQQYIPHIPAGETGDALPNGISLWHDRFGTSADTGVSTGRLTLLAADMSIIAVVNTSPTVGVNFPSIAQDRTNFYVVPASTGALWQVTPLGVVTFIATLPVGANRLAGLGVSQTGIVYWTQGRDTAAIHRYDLNTLSALSDLYSVTATMPVGGTFNYVALSGINENPGEILVLADGSIVLTWYYFTSGFVEEWSVLSHISADGVLLHEYTWNAETELVVNHIHYAQDDPATISIWFYIAGDFARARFGRVDLATGTILQPLDQDMFSGAANANNLGFSINNPNPNPFGPSSSCTMLMIGYGSALGTVEVIKIVNGIPASQRFDFTAGGGLSPASFTLGHGESQLYSDVPPGSGYSIVETVPPGWSVAYAVNNGSPIDNLLVEALETTRVTVTNSNTPVAVCPPQAWLAPAQPGCVAIGELPDNDG